MSHPLGRPAAIAPAVAETLATGWLRAPRAAEATPLHAITAMAWRRRQAGSGSNLWELLAGQGPLMESWADLDAAFADVAHAVIGAVAANEYMPARYTADLDFAVAGSETDAADQALRRAGWSRRNDLVLRAPLTGSAWTAADGRAVDVITVPDAWGDELVADAMRNRRRGMPMATLPHLVALKLISGRSIDAGDLTRMLGHQDAVALEAVGAVARRVLAAEELADLERVIELGRLKFGPPPR